MGRATRWLKSLLGMKKQSEKEKPTIENGRKEEVGIERRWSFTKHQSKDKGSEKENQWVRDYITETDKEQSKHAIAVAAATAAAADAAVAAAQAAVAVVRLTSHGSRSAMFPPGGRERCAAVKIQTLFRGYLARKALRALRGLVKLQAHVRGYLVRKRAAATLQSMQALVRAQATARSQRANRAPNKSNKQMSEFRHRKSVEKFDETRNEFHSKRLSASYHEPCNAYEGSPKIVEIDTYHKPRSRSRRINPTMYDFSGDDYYQYPTMSSPLPSPLPAPGRLSMPGSRNPHHSDYEWSYYGDEYRLLTAQSTPHGFSNSYSIRPNGPMTPTKSVCGDSFFRPNDSSNFPSYMADTHSFRAKLRSQSAPKQRPESRPKKKLTLEEIMAARSSISGVRMQRSSSQVQDGLNF